MGALFIVLLGLFGAGAIILLAKAIVDANDGFDLNRAIARGAAEGIVQGLEEAAKPGGAFDRALDNAMRNVADEKHVLTGDLSPMLFVWEVSFEFMRTCRTMSFAEANALAVDTVKTFIADEGIKFGNPAYAWDQSAARTLARECEIEYWETTS